ncbi:MAG: TIGR03905 family TSCPD domain-containing protein [Spirochaetia bacterium]|nr:TIGR03905 family TSCPD domain-containing protein [Spirochaetia bacterium]
MHHSYKTEGVCAHQIDFDIEDETVRNIIFYGGCPGNHLGIAALADGMKPEDIISRLAGIKCGYKESSCPDQLARALQEIIYQKKE